MHAEHRVLLEALVQARRAGSHGRFDLGAYLGSDHAMLNVSVPDRRRIVKGWLAAHRSLTPDEILAVADSLMDGKSHEERTLATLLLAGHRGTRPALGPRGVDRWLERLVGWAEVDSLCQNVFQAEELLADWPSWSALIRRLALDPNINKRRAALVLLVGPVGRSDDQRLSALAFETIGRLKGERAILITKAVSWLLRNLVARHLAEVAAYLEAEAASLPAIAVRETRRKLETGRK